MLSWLIESSIFWPHRSIKLCTRACLTPKSKAPHCCPLTPKTFLSLNFSSSYSFTASAWWFSTIQTNHVFIKCKRGFLEFLDFFTQNKKKKRLFQTFFIRHEHIQISCLVSLNPNEFYCMDQKTQTFFKISCCVPQKKKIIHDWNNIRVSK